MVPFHIQLLHAELSRRKSMNPRYSLRAFATRLRVDPGALSRILSGKQAISQQILVRMVQGLKLIPEEASRFVHSVLDEAKALALVTIFRKLGLEPTGVPPIYLAIQPIQIRPRRGS